MRDNRKSTTLDDERGVECERHHKRTSARGERPVDEGREREKKACKKKREVMPMSPKKEEKIARLMSH